MAYDLDLEEGEEIIQEIQGSDLRVNTLEILY
jgi:hypothetical protein